MIKLNAEALKKLDIDIENKLQTLLDKKTMHDILEIMLKKSDKREQAKLMCDDSYFTTEELLFAIQKTDEKILKKILDEPKSEKEMAIPIVRELNKKKYKASQEVILPKIGRAKPRKMDVAGYKKSFLSSVSVIGFELKSELTRGAVDKAFSQAKDYTKFCEQVVVCFSPMLYAKYKDVIEEKAEEMEGIGVWIVGASDIYLRLAEAYSQDIPDKYQRIIVDYIDGKKIKKTK